MATKFPVSMDTLAYAGGAKPMASGVIKRTPEDFQVDEILGFDPDNGEAIESRHTWIQIMKTGINTSYMAQLLAQSTGGKLRDIGYSGMKDRHAVTTQWFSVPTCVKIAEYESEIQQKLVGTPQEIEFLSVVTHPKKLKRGVHRRNRFRIMIRDLHGLDESVLQRIKQQGVPNYFGGQRFGSGFANLSKAESMFEKDPRRVKREQRSIYLSSARSFLFNQIVSARLKGGTWLQPLVDEPMNLNATGSVFTNDSKDPKIQDRLTLGDIHTTGTLWGSQAINYPDSDIGQYESQVVDEWPTLRDGLLKFGLKAARRPLRVMLEDFSWEIDGTNLELKFSLTKGAYATSVLREIAAFTDESSRAAVASS